MFQFNRYGFLQNTNVSKEALFSAIIQYNKDSNVIEFYFRLISLLEKHEDVSICLMALRVFSWLQNDGSLSSKRKEDLFKIVENIAKNKLDCFSQKELLGLLGAKWFIERDLTDSIKLAYDLERGFTLGEYKNESIESQYLYGLPCTSGFFSTIESILLLWFFATIINRKTLVLAPERYWWSYEVRFEDLFGSLIAIAKEEDARKVSWIPRDSVSQWFQTSESTTKTSFNNFKCNKYPLIISMLNNYFIQYGAEKLPPVDVLVFIRGGDKLEQETVSLPENLVIMELEQLKTHGRIGLLSDDWAMANKYATKLPYVENLTQSDSAGHFLVHCRTRNDVMKIIQNVLALCFTPVAIGCPSSNLINAVNYYRRGVGREVYKSELFPISTYLLL